MSSVGVSSAAIAIQSLPTAACTEWLHAERGISRDHDPRAALHHGSVVVRYLQDTVHTISYAEVRL